MLKFAISFLLVIPTILIAQIQISGVLSGVLEDTTIAVDGQW